MIEIKDLKKEDVGRWVEYMPAHNEPEMGRIKSWNDTFIFVVYKCDNKWVDFKNYTGCATSPEDLSFVS